LNKNAINCNKSDFYEKTYNACDLCRPGFDQDLVTENLNRASKE